MIKERVDAGVKWLDETHPNWRDRVNVDILDMYSDSSCILGQMFSQYAYAREILGGRFCTEHGFSSDDPSEYHELTKEWKGRLTMTYDLTKPYVPPGKYKVVQLLTNDPLTEVLWVSREVTVVSPAFREGVDDSNYVIADNLRLYKNPPVAVVKV